MWYVYNTVGSKEIKEFCTVIGNVVNKIAKLSLTAIGLLHKLIIDPHIIMNLCLNITKVLLFKENVCY